MLTTTQHNNTNQRKKMTSRKTISACIDCYTYTSGDITSFDYHYTEKESDSILLHIEECIKDLCQEHGFIISGNDLGFSYSSCECCGSPLGGDRHELIFINNNNTTQHTPTEGKK